jgi:hypothetical protein
MGDDMNNDQLYFYNRGFNDCLAKFLDTQPAKTLTDEEIVDIIQRLTAKWTDEFKNYENDSDEPEENKLRDDVFAILRKAQE